MTTTDIFTVLKLWINTVFNSDTTTLGNCTFTNGSKIITGTGFLTSGLVNNYMIKRTSDNIDFFSKVESFTDTQITLYDYYLGISGNSVAGEFISEFHPVMRGEQASPKPKKEYLVIHQPMTVLEYASGNESKVRKVIDDEGTPQEIVHGYIDYTKHYQATISLEEVGFEDNGDKLRALKNSLRLQTIKDYFRNSKVSILRTETITPIPQISENIWELRSTMDLIILFPDEDTYDQGFIETVEFEGIYNN